MVLFDSFFPRPRPSAILRRAPIHYPASRIVLHAHRVLLGPIENLAVRLLRAPLMMSVVVVVVVAVMVARWFAVVLGVLALVDYLGGFFFVIVTVVFEGCLSVQQW